MSERDADYTDRLQGVQSVLSAISARVRTRSPMTLGSMTSPVFLAIYSDQAMASAVSARKRLQIVNFRASRDEGDGGA
jgi:hypothetical protein